MVQADWHTQITTNNFFCLSAPHQILFWSVEKSAKNVKPVGLWWFSPNPMNPNHDQGHWKWYKMVEVNCTHKHGRYERIQLKSLHAMSNNKVLPRKTSGQIDKQDWSHKLIYYSYGSKRLPMMEFMHRLSSLHPCIISQTEWEMECRWTDQKRKKGESRRSTENNTEVPKSRNNELYWVK